MLSFLAVKQTPVICCQQKKEGGGRKRERERGKERRKNRDIPGRVELQHPSVR